MFGTSETPANHRPAVVDGRVVLLPTLTGLMTGESGLEPAPTRDLWSALAAAVMAESAFEDLEDELSSGTRTLAEVIDLDSRRPSS